MTGLVTNGDDCDEPRIEVPQPIDVAEYLVAADSGFLWLQPDYDAPEITWAAHPLVAKGVFVPSWSRGDVSEEGVRRAMEVAVDHPLRAYPTALSNRPLSVVTDPALTGIFRVAMVTSCAGSFSEHVCGLWIFLTIPDGYVLVVAEAATGGYALLSLLRPRDKPEGVSMLEFLDAVMR